MKKWIGYATFYSWDEKGNVFPKVTLSVEEVDTEKKNPFTGKWSLPSRPRTYAACLIIDITEKKYLKNRWHGPNKRPSEFEMRLFETLVAERESLDYTI